MMHAEEFLKDFPNVTFVIRKKTIRLFELYKNKKKAQAICNLLFSILAFSMIYMLLKTNTYLLFFTDYFNDFFSSGEISNLPISSFDLWVLQLSFITIILNFVAVQLYLRHKKKYNELRIHMLHIVHTGFCSCHRGIHMESFMQKILDRNCDCKERYVKKMDKLGIDVIFEKSK